MAFVEVGGTAPCTGTALPGVWPMLVQEPVSSGLVCLVCGRLRVKPVIVSEATQVCWRRRWRR